MTRLVIGREIGTRLRQKAFIASSLITLVIVLGIAVLPGLLDDDDTKTYDIGLVSGPAAALREPLRQADRADGDLELTIRSLDDRASADRQVRDEDLDVAVAGDRIVVRESAGDDLRALLEGAARSAQVTAAVDDGAVEADVARRLTDSAPLTVAALDPEDEEETARRGMVTFGTFLLLGQVFGFGFAVASGVVEEKSSRVVEVLLAKISPNQLLAAKVIGVGILGIGQLVALIALALVAATAAGTVDLPPGWIGAVAQILVWFLVGYGFYACAFAVAGALASRPEEMQSTTTPITFVLMAGYIAAFVTIGDPEGMVAVIGSFVPVTAPMVMPLRSVYGSVPGWQIAGSVALTLAAAVAMIPVASRIYRGAALRTRQAKLTEAWRADRPSATRQPAATGMRVR